MRLIDWLNQPGIWIADKLYPRLIKNKEYRVCVCYRDLCQRCRKIAQEQDRQYMEWSTSFAVWFLTALAITALVFS